MLLRPKVLVSGGRALARAAPAVGLVVHTARRVAHGHVAVLLEVVHRAARGVDRDVGEVRPAQPLKLGVEVGEVAALQQGVVAEADAGDDILGAERHLFGLGEEVGDQPV